MKQVILAKHTGRNDEHDIRFWNFNHETNNWYYADNSQYAIVDTDYGYQLVEVIGTANIRDDIEVEKDVVTFISNTNLQKKEVETNE